MGYTHSWYRPREIDPQTMDAIKLDFEKVSSTFSEINRIISSPGFASEPSDIAFTGVHGTAEPMVFCRISDAEEIKKDNVHENWMVGKCFEFCKTERQPYDLAVRCLLIVAKLHLKDKIRVFSDGSEEEWREAEGVCRSALGASILFKIRDGELLI